jgi:hypothetical protein
MNSPTSLEQAPITKDTKLTNICIAYNRSMTCLAIAMASHQKPTRYLAVATKILRFLTLKWTWYRIFSFVVVFHPTVYILYCADSNPCLVTNRAMLLTVPTE